MKIEIGESIILSWLRHVKNCQIVQLNWKSSFNNWELYHTEKIDEIVEYFKSFYESKYQLDIFNKNKSFSQIIRQGEIDVIGVELKGGKIANLYAVDIAFHENGLLYGSKETTIAKVLQKLIRTSISLLGYFDMHNAEIIFASPKVGISLLSELISHSKNLEDELNSKWGFKFKFRIIANEDFNEKIFQPMFYLSEEIADTSELFMRSIQLHNIFNKKTANRNQSKINTEDTIISNIGLSELKIGALVRNTFPELILNKKISETEIASLQLKEYSKKVFDINYPFLKKFNKTKEIKENRSLGLYPRYFAKPIIKFNNEEFLLCSEWYEKNKEYYLKWLNKFN